MDSYLVTPPRLWITLFEHSLTNHLLCSPLHSPHFTSWRNSQPIPTTGCSDIPFRSQLKIASDTPLFRILKCKNKRSNWHRPLGLGLFKDSLVTKASSITRSGLSKYCIVDVEATLTGAAVATDVAADAAGTGMVVAAGEVGGAA